MAETDNVEEFETRDDNEDQPQSGLEASTNGYDASDITEDTDEDEAEPTDEELASTEEDDETVTEDVPEDQDDELGAEPTDEERPII